MQLSPRLRMVSNLIPPSRVLADIGTDHAYLPISLLREGKISFAVASDIHEGPAARAGEHIAAEGLSDKIAVRVGPGLSTLAAGEADGAVIAGMGGLMMIKILEEGAATAAKMEWFVLQPQNHARELREWLSSHGFRIEKEALAREDRQLYQAFLVRRGGMEAFSGIEAETGKFEMRKDDPLFGDFLRGLIKKREFTIRGVAENTENPVNREKRERALAEKKELEALLWKLQPKH